MRTFATLASSLTYGRAGKGILVGRMVANTAFIEGLGRYSGFERFRFYVGENADADAVQELFGDLLGDRLEIRNLLELAGDFAAANLSVLHYSSHLDRFGDLVWLRDRHATRNIPITGQIHTLSYARVTNDYLRFLLTPPRENDAILCSSESGKRVVQGAIAGLVNSLAAQGVEFPPLGCEFPVIPLGIETRALQGGDGVGLRNELEIPSEAYCALVLARFSEYDKMDLFPLLLAFRGLVSKLDRPAILLLAGARQGTKTPEMIQIWARALKIEDRLRFLVDFPEERKRDVLAAADVFVSPTDNLQETFGITVIEAMAAGVPPIVADFDGYRESVIDGVGLRVPTTWSAPGPELRDTGPLLHERPLHLLLGQTVTVDLEALESAMLRLAEQPELHTRLSRAAQARAEERYDWSRVIPRYEKLWNELAAKNFRPEAQLAPRAQHPLALDYAKVFAHYPTALSTSDRLLSTSDHGKWLLAAGQTPPIYPDLSTLFDATMVSAAMIGADAPVAADELVSALTDSFPTHPRWHAEHLLAWMQKQGLLTVR